MKGAFLTNVLKRALPASIAVILAAALDDGHMFFAVSAVTGAGLNTLMLAVGEQVAKLRAELAVSDEPVDLRDDEWERRRLQLSLIHI